VKLSDLAGRLDCVLEGDGEIEIVRVAGIQDAGPGDVTTIRSMLPSRSCGSISPAMRRENRWPRTASFVRPNIRQ